MTDIIDQACELEERMRTYWLRRLPQARARERAMTDIIDQACELEERMRTYWLQRQKEQASSAPSAQECEECGAVIPEARRKAVPGCRLCIDCRRVEEQRQKFKR